MSQSIKLDNLLNQLSYKENKSFTSFKDKLRKEEFAKILTILYQQQLLQFSMQKTDTAQNVRIFSIKNQQSTINNPILSFLRKDTPKTCQLFLKEERFARSKLLSGENGSTLLTLPRFMEVRYCYTGQEVFRNAILVENPDLIEADVISQIGREIHTKMNSGLKELRVQLKPEHLGSVTLKVSMIEDVLFVDINAENAAVKSIIESHIQDLRQSLINKGIEVGRFNVSAEGDMSKSGSQGRTFYSQAQDKKEVENANWFASYSTQGFARQTTIDLWI